MKWSDQFVELDKKRHYRSSFDCGQEPLNSYLRTMAAKHREASINVTRVLPGDERLPNGLLPICAFYTIAFASIGRETLPEQLRKKLPTYPVPVYLLGQLAVSSSFQGKGLGKATLVSSLAYLCRVSEQLPAYAIVVDCLDDNAQSFYSGFGFEFLSKQQGKVRLFLPIRTAKKAIAID